MFRRIATVRAAPAQTRSITAYSLFMKQVYKTNKFPAVKAAAKAAFAAKGISGGGKAVYKAYAALSPKAKNALKTAGAKIKQKAPVTQKMKYFRKMHNSPKVKGLQPAAKGKKLAQLWAKRQGNVTVSPL